MRTPLCILTSMLLLACSSSTTIRVSDPDARIYVNGEYLGSGEARYTDRKPAFTVQEVTLRKRGCVDESYRFRRNERPDIGAIIGAFLFVVPAAWFTQYKRERAYEFDCFEVAAEPADGVERPAD